MIQESNTGRKHGKVGLYLKPTAISGNPHGIYAMNTRNQVDLGTTAIDTVAKIYFWMHFTGQWH